MGWGVRQGKARQGKAVSVVVACYCTSRRNARRTGQACLGLAPTRRLCLCLSRAPLLLSNLSLLSLVLLFLHGAHTRSRSSTHANKPTGCMLIPARPHMQLQPHKMDSFLASSLAFFLIPFRYRRTRHWGRGTHVLFFHYISGRSFWIVFSRPAGGCEKASNNKPRTFAFLEGGGWTWVR